MPISSDGDNEITKSLESNFFKRSYELIKETMNENELLTVFDFFLRCLNTCLWNCDRTK